MSTTRIVYLTDKDVYDTLNASLDGHLRGAKNTPEIWHIQQELDALQPYLRLLSKPAIIASQYALWALRSELVTVNSATVAAILADTFLCANNFARVGFDRKAREDLQSMLRRARSLQGSDGKELAAFYHRHFRHSRVFFRQRRWMFRH